MTEMVVRQSILAYSRLRDHVSIRCEILLCERNGPERWELCCARENLLAPGLHQALSRAGRARDPVELHLDPESAAKSGAGGPAFFHPPGKSPS
jgi:hypothetical protein